MRTIGNILVIQTAFIGDAILTLPLVRGLKEYFPHANIDILVTPRAQDLFKDHPDIHEAIPFDKRGRDKGFAGLRKMVRMLRGRRYDLAFVPHRSLRSALASWLARIPLRIGFDRSAGRFLFTKSVRYGKDLHEIDRNLTLLEGIGIKDHPRTLPRLYPSGEDAKVVDKLLFELEIGNVQRLIALAPGTVWNTKRWLKERFASLAVNLDGEGYEILLVGGMEDRELCSEVCALSGSMKIHNTAGKLSLLQSAELIRRCKLLVANDSAPLHLAVGVGTPVVAVFGATVPAFGFAPMGRFDSVVEIRNLRCRPCSSHGGDRCPIKTFECMTGITHERVFARVMGVLERISPASASN
jgi:heptosyltransferase-2